MSEVLKSIGLDVGTTSTQMVVSALTIENRASGFSVPDMDITRREVLYKSPVYFTPLLSGDLVDGNGIREIVEKEYWSAGIRREEVDTGAVIITGETSRKENARAVLEALSDYAGDFVVATAGPDLESILAAKGAGAVDYSADTGKTVLHMDIGGGTSNLTLIREGTVIRTGCLNVGGRLVRFDDKEKITYISPVLAGLTDLKVGALAEEGELYPIAQLLAAALETAAGRGFRPIPEGLFTEEAETRWEPPEESVAVSFSGGVADCIEGKQAWQTYGDIGVLLGRAIGESSLCSGDYRLGKETIRATVIGAGCHSAQLSGSTVYYQNVHFPLKNLPVTHIHSPEEVIAQSEGVAVIAWPGIQSPDYGQIKAAAKAIVRGKAGPIILCLEQDMAKALGQALALELPREAAILCIDRVRLPEGSYLDIGSPAGGALPVVVKTLVMR